jgi:hypothetical protein
MKFFVKNHGADYKELIIRDDGVTMESGLMTEVERRNLAEELQSAIDDLLSGLEPSNI